MVTLLHSTPRRNLKSILTTGLQPGLARGKTKAVWLATPGKRQWAREHVSERHSTPEADVITLTVTLPREALRRFKRGVWTCPNLISPQSITRVGHLGIFRGDES
jgi:hypothetical protein